MAHEPAVLQIKHLVILSGLTATMSAAIFVLDTKTDLEIAAAVFYVVVILLSLAFC